jgi:hypothetical protein
VGIAGDNDGAGASQRPEREAVFSADGKLVFAWGYGPPKVKTGRRTIAPDAVTVKALRARR